MITFRINDMRFEYHSPNIVPFPEFVLDACDLAHDWTYPIEEEISNLLRVAMESDEFVVEGEANASSTR